MPHENCFHLSWKQPKLITFEIMNQEQLQLDISVQESPVVPIIHDPYWDELEKECDIVNATSLHTNPPIRVLAPQQGHSVGAQISWSVSQYKSVGAQVEFDTKKAAPQHDTHWIEKYWVQRGTNKYWYYRYCWMEGRKKQRRYIGSVNSATAKNKKQMVENAIASGDSPEEIINLIAAVT
jgi:hypothetical protein